MNFILATFGTTGDINPYIALGVALKKRGYSVKFLANEYFKNLIEKHGLQFIQVGTSREFQDIVSHKHFFHPRKAFDFVTRSLITRYMRDFYNVILREANSRSILISQSFAPAPRIVHEKYSIPYISVNLQPFSFWSYLEPPVYSGFKLPENIPLLLKRHILQLVNKLYIDKKFASGINPFLKELSLSNPKNYFSEWLYSPEMVIGAFPELFSRPVSDWPCNTRLTGFIAMDEHDELSPVIKNFLKDGKPPLIFTFGSSMPDTGSLFKEAIKATNHLKARAILITKEPVVVEQNLGNNILTTSYVPFQSLFPFAEAIVHHGGIGTIAHAISAGKPQLMVPFAHDQPDNVERTIKLGIGLRINARSFSSRVLVQKLDQLLSSDSIKKECLKYSAMINFDESVECIVNVVEEFALAKRNECNQTDN